MSKVHKVLVLASVLMVAAICAPAAKADTCSAVSGNLVTNCGFETGNFSGWTQSGNTTNTGVGNFQPPGPNSGNFDAFFGTVGTNAVLSQSIITTPGTTYTVTFFLRNHGASTPNFFSASFAGVTLMTLNDSPVFPYTQFTFSVVATGASSTLSFSSLHPGSEWFLDDISVTSVPEPATMLLFGTGMVSLTAAIRRRRKVIK